MILLALSITKGLAQGVLITGQVLEFRDRSGLEGVTVRLDGVDLYATTDKQGFFRLTVAARGAQRLHVSASQYQPLTFPVILEGDSLELGPVFLKRDLEQEKQDHLITLTEGELVDDTGPETQSGLLQATRDVFLNRAAFDFGQAFFRIRGYDSREGVVLINGIPLNRNWDDRPQWNNWGGLNDATRNQEFNYGLEASDHTFGGLLGATHIDMSPFSARPGLRVSAAASNRTYSRRLMATYHSGKGRKGMAFSLALSRRWGEEGFVSGTPYDAYSAFISAGLVLGTQHTLSLSVINAYNNRGRSSAITEEVAELLGPRYNPYWGWQDGERRSSRTRTIHEPIAMLNYDFSREDFRLRVSMAYQWGVMSFSRTGYFNAPNPDPVYYRYLPSYYINSPIGANFTGATEARNSLMERPQWPWTSLYEANTSMSLNGNAAYASFEDRNEENTFTVNTLLNLPLGKLARIDAGLTIRSSSMESFARIRDLLGANYLRDTDPFSDTRNDLRGELQKGVDDAFNYHYQIDTEYWTSFLQTRFFWKQWDFYVAGEYAEKSFQRNGFFLNERFPDTSYGPGEEVDFRYAAVKGGLTHGLNSRHWFKLHGVLGNRPPSLKNIFINPRENGLVVPDLTAERVKSIDLGYHLRLPDLKGRISAYYTRLQGGTDINFYYVDSGLGSDFVQEAVTGLDRLFKGIELGLEFQLSPATKATVAGAVGRYEYASDPRISINFDPAGADEELRSFEGTADLGRAFIKGDRLARGPQTAFSLGIEYRDPSYWWVGATANYLADAHLDMAFIKRTESFRIDPDTGAPFPGITEAGLRELLRQERLPKTYLLNLVGGKSWLYNGKYISAFLSINNLFDTVYKSGGYEQSRNGNYGQMYRDNLSGSPSFGPKYWYGSGRTYFLNLAISF